MSVTLNTGTYEIVFQSKSPETHIKKVQYGDGYAQIVVDGINYDRETFNIEFVPVDAATSLALETILLNSVDGTANILSYTPLGESSAKYYIANGIIKDTVGIDLYQISCTLERQFPIL